MNACRTCGAARANLIRGLCSGCRSPIGAPAAVAALHDPDKLHDRFIGLSRAHAVYPDPALAELVVQAHRTFFFAQHGTWDGYEAGAEELRRLLAAA